MDGLADLLGFNSVLVYRLDEIRRSSRSCGLRGSNLGAGPTSGYCERLAPRKADGAEVI
jgi:hypothetical protein